MQTVQVSDRYRVTIPEPIRKKLGPKVGDELLLEKVGEGTYRFKVVKRSSQYHERLLQLLRTAPRRTGKPEEIPPQEMKRLEPPRA